MSTRIKVILLCVSLGSSYLSLCQPKGEFEVSIVRQRSLSITGASEIIGDTLKVDASILGVLSHGIIVSYLQKIGDNNQLYFSYRNLFDYRNPFTIRNFTASTPNRSISTFGSYVIEDFFHSFSVKYLHQIYFISVFGGLDLRHHFRERSYLEKVEKEVKDDLAMQIITNSSNLSLALTAGIRLSVLQHLQFIVSYEYVATSLLRDFELAGKQFPLSKYSDFINFGIGYSFSFR